MTDTVTENQEPTLQAEQAADLRQLEAMAADAPQAPGMAPETAPAPEAPALDKELASVLLMVSKMVAPALPSVAAIYTPETCELIGGSVAAVCNKHGWLQGGIGGKYGEELMCLAVVGPIAWATVEAAKTDIEARRKDAKPVEGKGGGLGAVTLEKPVTVPTEQPGQKSVTVGTVMA